MDKMVTKTYAELDEWISNLTEIKVYDLTVDTTGMKVEDFFGGTAGCSHFGKKLANAKDGILFNLSFAFPDNIEIVTGCFNNAEIKIPLKSVNILKADNVINTSFMFNNCTSLEKINISSLNKISNAENMFKDCNNLKEIYILNTSPFESNADLLNSPINTIYTNKEIKKYLINNNKILNPQNIDWIGYSRNYSYAVVDKNDESKVDYNNKNISGKFVVRGKDIIDYLKNLDKRIQTLESIR